MAGHVIAVAALIGALAVAAPIARNEFACMSPRASAAPAYRPLLPPEARRNGVDTFLTYPEWSIVYAYEDLAAVTRRAGEEHFGYWRSVKGYWTSLCSLSQVASRRGDITTDVKAMLYIIGVSFSGEMAVKGLYETTIGRLSAWLRGPERTPDDNFAVKVAEDYAAFLRQTPWYEYPFWPTLKAYWMNREPGAPSIARTVERRFALTMEYGVKAIYAKGMGLLAAASPAKLRIDTIVTGVPRAALAAEPDAIVKSEIPDGIVVETPRYRAFTAFLRRVAAAGGSIREIAGNDRIFVTATGEPGSRDLSPFGASVMFSVEVQARPGQRRFGVELPVAELANFIRRSQALGLTFEHAYDY